MRLKGRRLTEGQEWRLSDKPVVVFGSGVQYSWNLLRQREQNLVERLAAVTEVVYLERHGTTSKGPRHIIKEVLRRAWPAGAEAERQAPAPAGFRFVRTPVLPIQGSALPDRINSWLIARKLRRVVSVPLEECCALVCNPSPYVLATLLRVRFRVVVDDVAQRYSESPEIYGTSAERIDLQLAALANVRTCDSVTLAADRAIHGMSCWQMPQGVDVGYSVRPAPRGGLPDRTDRLSGPETVGFLGAVSKVFDWKAILGAAAALSGVRFVVWGPVIAPLPEPLPPNVEIRGWVAPEQAPEVIASFSVGIIPYVRNRRTEAVLPTKLVEYLAAGVRVVSSALPDVVAMSNELGPDLVRVYEDSEGLPKAIRELAALGPIDEATRSSVYERYNWDHLVDEWVEHVEQEMNAL
jgi:glycosyltransferase involved in cell wall biosynthesis